MIIRANRFPGCWSLAAIVVLCVLKLPARGDENTEPKIPPPEDIVLETRDGVRLHCTYYPGTLGKKTAPIIMLHGWEGGRGDFEVLAGRLQELGHAVIAPDLRGHGASVRRRIPGRDDEIIRRDRMGRADLSRMVQFDVEAVKSFLLQKNNQGELNIELLCVVGAEMGAVVALNWAALDWSWPLLPTYKQGQDVKALVLLSPQQQFMGMSIRDALANRAVRSDLSVLLVVGGNDSRAFNEARRIHSTFERFRPPRPRDRDEQRLKQDLFFVAADTNLQGTRLLGVRGLNVDGRVAEFIRLRLVNRQDEYRWTDRTLPF